MQNMTQTRKQFVAATFSALLTAGLAACGGNPAQDAGSSAAGDDKTIVVGASPTPHAEILTNAVAPVLAEQGYTLVVKEFNDYVQPNTALEAGELDANFFQHVPYLDTFNEENGTHLVSVAAVHYEPLGVYPGKTSSLDDLAEGAVVAIPNDTTNEARALLLLEQEGLIKIRDGADVTATVNDVVENRLNLQFEELEAATIPNVLADVDIAVINSNYALPAGLSVEGDALAVEDPDGTAAQTYKNVIVVREGDEDTEKTKALVAAVQDPSVAEYINETYDGSVLPVK